jgi:hypothetical protein
VPLFFSFARIAGGILALRHGDFASDSDRFDSQQALALNPARQQFPQFA